MMVSRVEVDKGEVLMSWSSPSTMLSSMDGSDTERRTGI